MPAFGSRLRYFCLLLPILVLLSTGPVEADRPTGTVPEVGVRNRMPKVIAIVNAQVCVEAGRPLQQQTILLDGGIIVDVGPDISIPKHAQQIDLSGRMIYPALIDAYSEIDIPDSQESTGHWNSKATPHRKALSAWKRNSDEDKAYRKAGFAVRLLAPRNGVLKGESAAVSTGTRSPADSVIREQVAQHIRLTTRGGQKTPFPRSPMGAVALARQSFYDATWYRDAWRAHKNRRGIPRPETNQALAALAEAVERDQLFVFNAPDEQYVLRANRFAVEFGLANVAVVASGREYQRLEAIADTDRTLIVPVDFPKPPNVATVEATQNATLTDLMHWHFAAQNPAKLHQAGVNVVLTSHGLKKRKDFRKQVIKAVEAGLDADDALRLCTIAPAKLMGVSHVAGSITTGKAAHLMITDGPWLEEKTEIIETWVDGERFEHHPQKHVDLDGVWALDVQSSDDKKKKIYLDLRQDDDELGGRAWNTKPIHQHTKPGDDNDNKKVSSVKLTDVQAEFGRLNAKFSADLWGRDGEVRITGTTILDDSSKRLFGQLQDEQGEILAYRGTRNDRKTTEADSDGSENKAEEEEDAKSECLTDVDVQLVYPLGAFGASTSKPTSQSVVFENATLWTCAGEGIIEGSILIQDGRIAAIGSKLKIPENTLRIDVSGKHITPGIIDCHSHMATDGGINEGTQAITAEVRIGDFIDATDIAIYRQLAGGVTTANVLHGSANPIGGQNQVIKLRWGQLPEEMKFTQAPGGIKFALGENVKQSNWGDDFVTRYPQSRLGVEQIMRDAFHAAKDYERQWQEWQANGKGLPPRKDLELDAILEIVNGERWIHCHSYRQDEILSLMRTLESFNIQIGTFQHILEGYKVAKEMAEHGAMGSAFSDWWGYKFEVYDAIPYNGALMHQAGIVVSFNSDDRELARHLNHEAAKAIKYGGVPRTEALKFVTINPAKQLRIDEWVGSLELGKQADLVVWSGDPLQITSRCEQTWIDGKRFFDISEDQQRRKADNALHRQLVRKILDSGEAMRKPGEADGLFRNLFPRHDEYCGHAHGHGH